MSRIELARSQEPLLASLVMIAADLSEERYWSSGLSIGAVMWTQNVSLLPLALRGSFLQSSTAVR
jgi:hypothetical protein